MVISVIIEHVNDIIKMPWHLSGYRICFMGMWDDFGSVENTDSHFEWGKLYGKSLSL